MYFLLISIYMLQKTCPKISICLENLGELGSGWNWGLVAPRVAVIVFRPTKVFVLAYLQSPPVLGKAEPTCPQFLLFQLEIFRRMSLSYVWYRIRHVFHLSETLCWLRYSECGRSSQSLEWGYRNHTQALSLKPFPVCLPEFTPVSGVPV